MKNKMTSKLTILGKLIANPLTYGFYFFPQKNLDDLESFLSNPLNDPFVITTCGIIIKTPTIICDKMGFYYMQVDTNMYKPLTLYSNVPLIQPDIMISLTACLMIQKAQQKYIERHNNKQKEVLLYELLFIASFYNPE